MALITCPECEAQVSDRAPTCPRCGAPVAALEASTPLTQPAAIRPKRHLKSRWWTLAVIAIVAVAGAGVFLWLSDQAHRQAVAAAQDEVWQSATTWVEGRGAPSEVGAEGTYFIIRSKEPGGPCTAAENEEMWQEYVDITADALGYVPSEEFLAFNGITRSQAMLQCNDLKQQRFSASVTSALNVATGVFEDLGVSEAAVAQLESMRGLDGSQVRTETDTAAGDLTITFQYDGLNGVQVRVERNPGT